MYKKFILFLVIFSSVSFFNLIFIPSFIINMLGLGVPLIMAALILLHLVYDKSIRYKSRFRIEMGLIVVAVILSMFGAYYFHRQNFSTTALIQRFIYFFLFYPLLRILKPKAEELIEIIVYVGFVYGVLYILQTIAYPVKLIDIKMFLDRSTLRITMKGSGFLFLLYLYGMTYYIKTYNAKYLVHCILALVVFILLGTRQVIAPAAFLTVLSVLFSKRVKSRALTIVLLMLMTIPVYFLFQDIFAAMFALSQKQSGNFSHDIRFKATVFYIFKFFPNKLSYITGNGIPSELSPYGMQIRYINDILKYYQSDIGVIGDFSKFGILFVIAEISIMVRIAFMRLPLELEFIKLNIIASLITVLTGSSFNSSDFIVIICISLYLAEISPYYDSIKASTASAKGRKETIVVSQ
jgi:hypothetical protein